MKKYDCIPHGENLVDQRVLTLGSTAQYCRIFSFLWVCSSCHRSGCRRLNDLSASCTPPAGPAHLGATNTTELILHVSCFEPPCPFHTWNLPYCGHELCGFLIILLGQFHITQHVYLFPHVTNSTLVTETEFSVDSQQQ